MSAKTILLNKGVELIDAETISIADDVNTGNISAGAVIHPGCRLSGAELSIAADCVIGAEGAATIRNCQLERGVELGGGYFENSTFLEGFKAGNNAHVRPGCLFEEHSSIAHSVGVKQTLFMPWVTAGSLINFCDCMMAGGTNRRNHSEIGSSYVHFNFTPHNDKATPSLLGDVPRGVLLNQPPIFLGGQGGLVGPASVPFGTVVPAGQIWRGEHACENQLVVRCGTQRNIAVPFDPRRYKSIARVVRCNLRYIGNLTALDLWYRIVRSRYLLSCSCRERCYHGARQRISEMMRERVKRLEELTQNLTTALSLDQNNSYAEEHRGFIRQWQSGKEKISAEFNENQNAEIPSDVLRIIDNLPGSDYISEIQSLTANDCETLTQWLNARITAIEALLRTN